MPSIVLEGFLIRVNSDDHVPAHVHVIRDGANYRVFLSGTRPPEAVAGRLKRSDVRRARRIVAEHRDELLAIWRKYHREE
jgi:Domain of unknown function (DUF4160)